jgi:ubiquinone/menaquinone biosynthesis C-methylase UbiE
VKIDSGTHHQKLDLHQTRYNPATRRIWPWPALLLEEVAECIEELPGDLWLDVACGEGQLGELVGKRKRLLGVNMDWQRLHRARTHPYTALIQGSVDSLPLTDGSVSGIASVETLEHIADMDAALGEFVNEKGS